MKLKICRENYHPSNKEIQNDEILMSIPDEAIILNYEEFGHCVKLLNGKIINTIKCVITYAIPEDEENI